MSAQGPLSDARRSLERVSEMLRSPSPERLETAVAELQQIRAAWSLKGLPQNDAARLHRSLSDCRELAEQAGALYLGLAAVVLSASGTYNAAGEAAPLSDSSRMSVEG